MYFALTTYNRMQFLQPSLDSLLVSEFPPGSHLIVSDDCSSPDIQEYIRSRFNEPVKNLNVKLIMNKVNIGCDVNVVRAIREAFFSGGEQFVIVTDSDAIYNPKWILKLLEAKSQISEEIGMIGVFNTQEHKQIEEYNENLIVKSSLGGLAVMLNRDVFMNQALMFRAWDWSYSYLCGRMKKRIFCTRNSYVEHIGDLGTHSTDGYSSSKAINFVAD